MIVWLSGLHDPWGKGPTMVLARLPMPSPMSWSKSISYWLEHPRVTCWPAPGPSPYWAEKGKHDHVLESSPHSLAFQDLPHY